MKIQTKLGKSLTSMEIKLMENARKKQYGKIGKDFRKEKSSVFFFVKDNGKIVSFGMLKPIKMSYAGKKYNIFGIGNILSVKKEKGYGKVLVQEMIKYLEKKGKTGLGFCGRKNMKFYEKAGLKTKKVFGKRFALKDSKTGKLQFEAPGDFGDGLYYEGKDKLISKMLKTKSIGTYWIPGLEEPHW